MKEIVAVLRIKMINKTKEALGQAGIWSFSAHKVRGRGQEPVDLQVLSAAQSGVEDAIANLGASPRFLPKRLLTIVVPDKMVKKVIKTIVKVNQTGHKGDGKIFVLPTMDAVRVRTKECGDIALDEAQL